MSAAAVAAVAGFGLSGCRMQAEVVALAAAMVVKELPQAAAVLEAASGRGAGMGPVPLETAAEAAGYFRASAGLEGQQSSIGARDTGGALVVAAPIRTLETEAAEEVQILSEQIQAE